eukprot:m.258302 g.258302  ORF g.258302 m.258302 type:complete len:615 (+) comp15539_c0_seq3:75-1919(+)
MAKSTPTDVGASLYTVLMQAVKEEQRSPEQVNSMLEFAFGNIHLLRQMPEKQRIAAVWHLVELGGIPLIVTTLQPGHQCLSMGMTLMGMMFADENLLAHKLGRLILTNKKFLPAIAVGLDPARQSDALMPFLVSQVLHNVLKSASSQHIKEVAAFEGIAKTCVTLGHQALKSISGAKTDDWRLLFVVVDILLLFETAGSSKTTDTEGVIELMVAVLSPTNETILKQHDSLLNRAAALCFLFTMRTRHSEDTAVQASRQPVFDVITALKETYPEAFQEPKMPDDRPLPGPHQAAITYHLLTALVELSAGDTTTGFPLHLTVKSRVKNWDKIEKDAEKKVRSPDFKQMYDEQMAAKKEKPDLVVSDSDSEEDPVDTSDDESAAAPSSTAAVDAAEGDDKSATSTKTDAAPTLSGDSTSLTTSTDPIEGPQATPDAQASSSGTSLDLASAVAKKNEGNTYFRGEMYDDALELFTEATTYLDAAEKSPKDFSDEAVELSKILGNMAECHLRLEDASAAIAVCNRATSLDPTNTKAYYRCAKAQQQLGKVYLAITCESRLYSLLLRVWLADLFFSICAGCCTEAVFFFGSFVGVVVVPLLSLMTTQATRKAPWNPSRLF